MTEPPDFSHNQIMSHMDAQAYSENSPYPPQGNFSDMGYQEELEIDWVRLSSIVKKTFL